MKTSTRAFLTFLTLLAAVSAAQLYYMKTSGFGSKEFLCQVALLLAGYWLNYLMGQLSLRVGE